MDPKHSDPRERAASMHPGLYNLTRDHVPAQHVYKHLHTKRARKDNTSKEHAIGITVSKNKVEMGHAFVISKHLTCFRCFLSIPNLVNLNQWIIYT